MAYTSREFPVPTAAVWAVVADPRTYPEWLLGAQAIRDVDDDWPAVGSSFHHRVGLGPFTIPDRSEVQAIEPLRLLELMVRAAPLIWARVTFRFVGDGRRTVVSVEEEPIPRVLGNMVRPMMDPVIHTRNHRSLRRLEQYVLARHPGTEPA